MNMDEAINKCKTDASILDLAVAIHEIQKDRIKELEAVVKSIDFQASRATSSHDKDCLCVACDIKRLTADKVTK